MVLAQLFRFRNHAGAFTSLWRDDHLGAEHPHDLAALHREGLSHADDAVVTSLSTDHGHRDAGVAGGGLDDGIAGLEQTLLLGVGDDCKRESVRRLKGTRRVVSVSGGTKISLRELLPAIGQLGLPLSLIHI